MKKEREIIFMYGWWCKNCRTMVHNFKSLMHDNKFKGLKISAMDVDDEFTASLSVKYSVKTVPSIIVLENGKELGRVRGLLSEEEMIKEFKKWSK